MPEEERKPQISDMADADVIIESSVRKVRNVNERKRVREALRDAQRKLDIKNDIASIFLTVPDDEIYIKVLKVILRAMRSKHGIFGYIDERGDLVLPSLTKSVWQRCRVRNKTIVFPPEIWGGIWGRALKEKKTLYANQGLKVPEGHVPITRVIVVPILYHGGLIGILEVANKATAYDEVDTAYLENIANYIAPILDARLERDKNEKERRRAEEALEKTKAELEVKVSERTEELQALNKRLRAMARQLSLTQARERRYIALWVHDSINQNLSFCTMKLQSLMKQAPSSKIVESLNEIYKIAQETISDMRSLTSQLSPPILYEMGLDAALEELSAKFRRDYDLKCVFHTDGEPKSMDRDTSVLLYELVLELLRNIVKHAKAERAVVESNRNGDEWQITVSDDGIGLDPEIISGKKKGKGFGLFAAREVMNDLGGSMDAASSEAGTTITLTLPVNPQREPAD